MGQATVQDVEQSASRFVDALEAGVGDAGDLVDPDVLTPTCICHRLIAEGALDS